MINTARKMSQKSRDVYNMLQKIRADIPCKKMSYKHLRQSNVKILRVIQKSFLCTNMNY